MPISRRQLLLGLAPTSTALALVQRAAARPALPEPSEFPAAPPVLSIASERVPQGGTFLVALSGDGILSAAAEFRGWQFPAVDEGGVHLAILPAGQWVGYTQQPAPGVYPVAMDFEVAGEGWQRLTGSIRVTATDFPVEHLTFAPQVAALLDPALTQREIAILEGAYGSFTPVRHWDGLFVRPSLGAVSDVYGSRRSYQGGPVSGSHSGVDFNAPAGAPVSAAAHGRVVLARPLPLRGNMVILDHGAGVHTGYCHLSDYWVEPGQAVRAGEAIAAVGATGLVTGPHLHWELVVGGQHVDGLRWLAL